MKKKNYYARIDGDCRITKVEKQKFLIKGLKMSLVMLFGDDVFDRVALDARSSTLAGGFDAQDDKSVLARKLFLRQESAVLG